MPQERTESVAPLLRANIVVECDLLRPLARARGNIEAFGTARRAALTVRAAVSRAPQAQSGSIVIESAAIRAAYHRWRMLPALIQQRDQLGESRRSDCPSPLKLPRRRPPQRAFLGSTT